MTKQIWDLNKLRYVRQLQCPDSSGSKTFSSPITHISINDKSGDIATVCGTSFYLWNINGQLITSQNTTMQITSFAMTIVRLPHLSFFLFLFLFFFFF